MPIVSLDPERGWMSSTTLLWILLLIGPQFGSPQPYSALWDERSMKPPGTCIPLRSHSELLAPGIRCPNGPEFTFNACVGPSLDLPSWCVQPRLEGMDKELFIEDKEEDWMWGLQCSCVCLQGPLRCWSEPELGGEGGQHGVGLASWCRQGLEWRNCDEHKDSKIKVGLPGHYKGIFIKRGGVTYLKFVL